MKMPGTTYATFERPTSTPRLETMATERFTTEGVTAGVTETEGITTGTRGYFETSTMKMPGTTYATFERPTSTPRVETMATERFTTEGVPAGVRDGRHHHWHSRLFRDF